MLRIPAVQADEMKSIDSRAGALFGNGERHTLRQERLDRLCRFTVRFFCVCWRCSRP